MTMFDPQLGFEPIDAGDIAFQLNLFRQSNDVAGLIADGKATEAEYDPASYDLDAAAKSMNDYIANVHGEADDPVSSFYGSDGFKVWWELLADEFNDNQEG